MKKILPSIILLIILTACQRIPSIELGGKKINVEIADDDRERSQGLMFREMLQDDHGMLFVYPDEKFRAFWMKNTLIPLDMIFINAHQEIVDIHTAYPCKEQEPCQPYGSEDKAQYILEVNAGFAEKNNLKTGDSVNINI